MYTTLLNTLHTQHTQQDTYANTLQGLHVIVINVVWLGGCNNAARGIAGARGAALAALCTGEYRPDGDGRRVKGARLKVAVSAATKKKYTQKQKQKQRERENVYMGEREKGVHLFKSISKRERKKNVCKNESYVGPERRQYARRGQGKPSAAVR